MAFFPGSEGITVQGLGRGLRKYPGKDEVVVLDYWPVDNSMLSRHAESRVEWYQEYGPVKVLEVKNGLSG